MEQFLNQAIQNKYINDRYLFISPVPEVLKGIDSLKLTNIINSDSKVTSPTFMLSLKGAELPETDVPPVIAPYAGQSVKFSSHAREPYGSVVVHFDIDNRFGNYYYIYKWINSLNDEKMSTFDFDNLSKLSYKNQKDSELLLEAHKSYAVDATIVPLDEFAQPIIYFNFKGLFPVRISGIETNDQTPNRLTASVDFAFSQMDLTFENSIQGLYTANQIPLQPTTTTITTTTTTTTCYCPTTTTTKHMNDVDSSNC